jgi:hypothetical protein
MLTNVDKTSRRDRCGSQPLAEGLEDDVSLADEVMTAARPRLSELQASQAYLSGRADANAAAAVEAALADPQSLLRRGLGDALRRREDAGPHQA